MPLGIVLRDLNPAPRLTLDKKEWQRQFLLMRSGLVIFFGVGHALHAIVTPVATPPALSDLEVAALELGDRNLLLNEL